jgi:hypothetical protein
MQNSVYREFLFRNYRCNYWEINYAINGLKTNTILDASYLYFSACHYTYTVVVYREHVWKSKIVRALA